MSGIADDVIVLSSSDDEGAADESNLCSSVNKEMQPSSLPPTNETSDRDFREEKEALLREMKDTDNEFRSIRKQVVPVTTHEHSDPSILLSIILLELLL